MSHTVRQKKVAVLEVLAQMDSPVGGKEIAELLLSKGIDISDRTVRLYLQELEEEGLIVQSPRKGRALTVAGRKELDAAKAFSRVGILSSRINQLTYGMDFDVNLGRGKVIVNVTMINPQDLRDYMDKLLRVFELGYAMGRLIGLLGPGESLGTMVVPVGKIGLCTVCSLALNGVLLKHGIPVDSLFSGLLELKDYQAQRFTEVIFDNGTSIDPLALFIQSGMTDYLGAIRDGNGLIGAGFREVPAASYELVVQLAERLTAIGLGAFQYIGRPEQIVYNIPVHEGTCGIVVVGGLNPTAVFEESDIRLESRALGGHMDFNRLFPFTQLPDRLKQLVG
jgi:HTH-type transcriptional regulator, global nitrogen regulator NrpRI